MTSLSAQIATLGKQLSDHTIALHEAIAHQAGLTGTDHKYLSIILEKGRLTAGELSALTGLTTGAATGVIDRLEKKKFVKRAFDPADRRKVYIHPDVKKASRVFSRSGALLKKKIGALIAGFSARDRAVIERYLVSTIEILKDVTCELNKT